MSNVFQHRAWKWVIDCFGVETSEDKVERNHRFLEESLELVQSLGCSSEEAHKLVDYVYDRPIGEPKQEVGGVMVTLAILCTSHDIDMFYSGNVELERILTRVDEIREKQAKKPKMREEN